MRVSFLPLFLVLFFVTFARACELDCKVTIPQAYANKATMGPILAATKQCSAEIARLLPESVTKNRLDGYYCSFFLEYFAIYNLPQRLYEGLFAGYFHGKCIGDDGIEPTGCRTNIKPDCPIVCGTSSSMISLWPKFNEIAYGIVLEHCNELLAKDSPARKQTHILFDRDVKTALDAEPRRIRGRVVSPKYPLPASDLVAKVDEIFDEMCKRVETICGQPSAPCDWRSEMTALMATFP
ncbi:hypothetical protein ONZ45_g4140 [Pleurotus djamor]|nr:hypothetical protein ONZ45_g4140 [Pleurotus djamor]